MIAVVETPVETVAPVVKTGHVKALVAVLRQDGGWLTRKALAALLGQPTASFERIVRATASVSAPQVVSFPGSPGYKIFVACSDEEVEHCINALRAQAASETKRANLYQHALNRRRLNRGAVELQQSLGLED